MMSDSPDPEIVANWLDLGRQFGDTITDRFTEETAITPYVHVFIYHIGYFMKQLGSVECFANYDIEPRHCQNKLLKNQRTSGIGGRGA